jgi:NAD(P)-dependent dehydrogenase (short-subunit alcohol dehydrogenase family)
MKQNTMNKVWFITGAGSGLGTGIARAALRTGDRVVATGRNLEKLRKAFPGIALENIEFVQLDVTDEAQAKAAVDEVMKRFGRIDVLVNNAGYSLLGNFEQMTTADIQQQFAPNFYGVVHLMQAALPVMRRQRSGHIINISSVAGVVGLKGVDGSRPGARGRLGGPRQCLRVDILPDVRQFAISNGNGEDPIVLERFIRGFDTPRSEANDQNPVSLRYKFGGLWI